MNKVLRSITTKVLLMPAVKKRLKSLCQFYYEQDDIEIKDGFKLDEITRTAHAEHLDIMENLGENDAHAIEQLVQMVLVKKTTIVEIGSWKGFSTSVLARSVADCGGSVFAVDHFMGNEGTLNIEVARTSDIYSIFRRNMIALGVWDIVHPLVMDSQTAAGIFADGTLDLVFIDADHRYESIKKDISAWLPKLRGAGILCGHDCEGYYSQYSEEVKKMIDEHLSDDYIFDVCLHPGVIKALHEIFEDRYSIMPDSHVWYYIKKGDD